jgi:DNA-binding MltR family transcriptional regulator
MSKNNQPKDTDRDSFDLCRDFVSELESANPRAKAIVAAAVLDEILARLIEKAVTTPKIARRLVRRHYAPLGTFSARIDSAFAFGLINDDQYDALNIMRFIRNEFAHKVNRSFNDNDIANECMKLQIDKHIVYPPGMEGDPEIRFIMNAAGLCGQLDVLLRKWEDRKNHPSKSLD